MSRKRRQRKPDDQAKARGPLPPVPFSGQSAKTMLQDPPIYVVTGVDRNTGAEQTISVEATDENDAAWKAQQQGLLPRRITRDRHAEKSRVAERVRLRDREQKARRDALEKRAKEQAASAGGIVVRPSRLRVGSGFIVLAVGAFLFLLGAGMAFLFGRELVQGKEPNFVLLILAVLLAAFLGLAGFTVMSIGAHEVRRGADASAKLTLGPDLLIDHERMLGVPWGEVVGVRRHEDAGTMPGFAGKPTRVVHRIWLFVRLRSPEHKEALCREFGVPYVRHGPGLDSGVRDDEILLEVDGLNLRPEEIEAIIRGRACGATHFR